jgi:hypothetical protein
MFPSLSNGASVPSADRPEIVADNEPALITNSLLLRVTVASIVTPSISSEASPGAAAGAEGIVVVVVVVVDVVEVGVGLPVAIVVGVVRGAAG